MHTALSDILHVISQALLVPDIILLIALIGYALFCIGSVLAEFFTEHRHYRAKMPQFLADLTNADEQDVPVVIKKSGLLRRQKEALMTVYDYRNLPGDALLALVRRLMNREEAHYDHITARNNTAAKVAPMLGLVGTLIPLGPGIEALGRADTALLSSSLLVAFDTTVAGLVVAAVCLVIGKIRSSWYDNYLSALDSAMATMVQKIEDSRSSQQPGSLKEQADQDTLATAILEGGVPASAADLALESMEAAELALTAELKPEPAAAASQPVASQSAAAASQPVAFQTAVLQPAASQSVAFQENVGFGQMSAQEPPIADEDDIPMAIPLDPLPRSSVPEEIMGSGMPLNPDFSILYGEQIGAAQSPAGMQGGSNQGLPSQDDLLRRK